MFQYLIFGHGIHVAIIIPIADIFAGFSLIFILEFIYQNIFQRLKSIVKILTL